MQQVRHYLGPNGRDHFAEWRSQMRDMKARIAIDRRATRLELGSSGDRKPLREGVWELRIDVGAGYRIYYTKTGATIMLLLCDGDKRKQSADIGRACVYQRNWQSQTGD